MSAQKENEEYKPIDEDCSGSIDEKNSKASHHKTFGNKFATIMRHASSNSDENSKSSEFEEKQNCSILNFTSDIDFDEVLTRIKKLNPNDYQHLFFFTINTRNADFFQKSKKKKKNKSVESLKKLLLKFGENRPIVLRLSFEENNATKFYYKKKYSNQLNGINLRMKNFTGIKDFPTFLISLLNEGDVEGTIFAEKLTDIKDSSLILKFLVTCLDDDDDDEKILQKLILKCAAMDSKSDLLAVLNVPFESHLKGEIFSEKTGKLLTQTFDLDESCSNSSSHESLNVQANFEDNSHLNPSALSKAIENKNKEVIDFLISHCTHLIQQLPFEHQIRVSTAAFETDQLDILCDLLEISDFPFPQKFQADIIYDGKLNKVIEARKKFEAAILAENFKEMSNYIDNNLDLKFSFNFSNKSALKQALDFKKYSSYFYLKSLGFKAIEFDKLEEILSTEELKKAKNSEAKQKKKNVSEALGAENNPVMLLYTRSFIHNRKIGKEQENEYRKKIKKWYENLYTVKHCKELLNVVSQCGNLKIIFDFESYTVDNVAFFRNALGLSTNIGTANIFIGAKLSDKKREQCIKGVLAHELCHYAMCLIYENTFHPYYKHDKETIKIFDNVVKAIDKWSSEELEYPSDECNRIISSVFQQYTEDRFHLELIVRVVQILAESDGNEEKLVSIENKFKNLFDFFEKFVLPEMRKFNLKIREDVKRLNRIVEIMPSISSQKLEFSELKDMRSLFENNFTIVQTNFPKLLFISIYKYLQTNYENLLDAKNIFISTEKLKNQEILNDYKKILTESQNLNVFIIYAQTNIEDLRTIVTDKNLKFIFIVSDINQFKDLSQQLTKYKFNAVNIEKKYGWNDFAIDSQKLLLETKINFQNNSQISFFDLLKNFKSIEEADIADNFSEIIDDQLLNFLLENLDVSINSHIECETSDKYFELIFQERKFVKNRNNKRNQTSSEQEDESSDKLYGEISHQKYLQEVQDKKIVLISDMAGSGKSWMMQKFSKILREQCPLRWVTYVDLKKFLNYFKAREDKIEFLAFVVEKILKPKFKFEANLFKKMYKNGRVCVIFDGFDEIAPECAEFVSSLAQSFDWNGGNQLWIATRDYFEVDLQQKLKLDIAYKFAEFTEENGVKMIVTSWVLNDIEEKTGTESEIDYENDIMRSKNFNTYLELAKELIKKISILKLRSIGLPQLHKMIAEISKDTKSSALDLTEHKIFKEFAKNLYRRWSDEKGQLRKEASIESQSQELTFWTFHEFMAMKSSFPEESDFCDLDPDDLSIWPDEEIIACGLMNKKGQNFYFFHETFREFFVAEFVVKIFKKKKNYKDIFLFLIKIFSTRKFGVVRMFLNNAFGDLTKLNLSEKKMREFVENLNQSENISYVFSENLENISNFLILACQGQNYEKVTNIFSNNLEDIFENSKSSEYPLNSKRICDFLLKFWDVNDLKNLILEKKVFHKIIESCDNIDEFEKFVKAFEEKVGLVHAQQALNMTYDAQKENILCYLCKSYKLDSYKVQQFLRIFESFTRTEKIMEMMEKCTNNNQNILHFCVQRGEAKILKTVWTEIEYFYETHNCQQRFFRLVTQRDLYDQNILQHAKFLTNTDFHETLWQLLVKTIDHEVLKDFIIQHLRQDYENSYEDNFIVRFLEINEDKVVKFTFDVLKSVFVENQYQEILNSKNNFGENLLQSAADRSKNVENFKVVWENFRELYKSDEDFLKFLREVDNFGNNIFNSIGTNAESKSFEFIVGELEKFATHEEIKDLITNSNKWNRNLLFNFYTLRSQKLFETIWKYCYKLFTSSEILEILQNCDSDGDNFFLRATISNRKIYVIDTIWATVTKFITDQEIVNIETSKNIKTCEEIIKKFKETFKIEEADKEILKLKWLKTRSLHMLDSSEILKQKIIRSELFNSAYDFYVLAKSEKLEIHEISWKFILEKFNNREDLIKLITRRSVHGSIFIHSLIKNQNFEIFEFTIKIIQKIFNKVQIHDIFEAKCYGEINLFSTAARDLKDVRVLQILWQMLEEYFEVSEIFKFIFQTDMFGSNILLHAAANSTAVFKFLWNEIKKFFKVNNENENYKLTNLVQQLNSRDQNILHVCVQLSDEELLKTIWQEIENFLENSPVSFKSLVMKQAKYEKYYVNHYLNILHISAKTNKFKFHETLWELLLQTFKSHDEFKSLIFQEDQDKNNFLCSLLNNCNLDIIKFTFENLRKFFNTIEIREILKPKEDKFFLQNHSNCIQTHQFLWEIFQEYFGLSELKKISKNLSGIFFLIIFNITASSAEIFKYAWSKIKNLINKETGFAKTIIEAINLQEKYQNFLFHICVKQKDKNLLKIMWTEVEKFFVAQNLHDNFKELVMKRKIGGDECCIFELTSSVNEIEFHETLWTLIFKTFENREELKNALVRNRARHGIFMQFYFSNEKINVIKFLLKTFKENFTDTQLQEMFKTRGFSGYGNILERYFVLFNGKTPTFDICWEFFKNVFKSSETKLLQLLEDVNTDGDSTLQRSLCYCNNYEILEIVLEDLKSLLQFESIKKLFYSLNKFDRNLLQICVGKNNSLEFQKRLWKIVYEFFNQQEIINLVKHTDKEDKNLLFVAVSECSEKIVKLTWQEIEKNLDHDDQINYLKSEVFGTPNLYKVALENKTHNKEVSLWVKNIFLKYNIRSW